MAAVWVSISVQVPAQQSHFTNWCIFTSSTANMLKWNLARKCFFLIIYFLPQVIIQFI